MSPTPSVQNRMLSAAMNCKVMCNTSFLSLNRSVVCALSIVTGSSLCTWDNDLQPLKSCAQFTRRCVTNTISRWLESSTVTSACVETPSPVALSWPPQPTVECHARQICPRSAAAQIEWTCTSCQTFLLWCAMCSGMLYDSAPCDDSLAGESVTECD